MNNDELLRNSTQMHKDALLIDEQNQILKERDEYGKAIDGAIAESTKPILVDGDVQGQLEYLRVKYILKETGLCFFIGYGDLHNGLFGDFVNGKPVLPTWYQQFNLLCENKKDDICIMIFDGLDKIGVHENVRGFFDEIIFNKSNLFPLPPNGKIVFIPRTKYLSPELAATLNEYREKFTTVRCYRGEEFTVDYGDTKEADI